MRAERLMLTLFLAGAACLGGSAKAQDGSPWSIEAEGGVCSVFYQSGGGSAHGFSWSPDGQLAWHVLLSEGPEEALSLQIRTAAGEQFSGPAEASEADEDGVRSYFLIGNDRRNARMIFSGDIVFNYQVGRRRAEQVIPSALMLPRISACMAQARTQPAAVASADEPRRPPEQRAGAPSPGSRQAGDLRIVANGSGVFIDDKGSLVTNAHVIQGCKAVGAVGAGAARVVAVDAASDLALLRFDRAGPYARLRETVRLGEPVTAAGFPLQSVLGNGLNITTGNISALAGIGGDRRQLQISAPVQPGNSGGALLDSQGRLVGIVVAQIRPGAAQNVNFAVAPYVVGAFLRENGIALPAPGPPAADVAAAARQFTVRVDCAA